MGYRSDVAIRIEVDKNFVNTQELVAELLKNIQTAELASGSEVENSIEDYFDEVDVSETTITLVESSVKWYIGYSFVDATAAWFDKYLEKAQEGVESGIIGAQMIRIGEDYEDIDEFYGGDLYHPMYIRREIEF